MSPSLLVSSRSEEGSEHLGRSVATALLPGMVTALHGDLGAGKTVFCRGVARGLGITEPVTSPTFTVVQEYQRPDGSYLFHLDMYRIDGDEAALAFGIEEYLFATDGIALVEWPERIEGLLSLPGPAGGPSLLTIRLWHAAREVRRIELPGSLSAVVAAAVRSHPDLQWHEGKG